MLGVANALRGSQLRRAESRYALERMGVSVTFSGGALDGLQRMIPVRAQVLFVKPASSGALTS